MEKATIIGIDLAKRVFQVHGATQDGRPVFRDLRWGVYVVLKAPTEYARACFKEYGLKTDASVWFGAVLRGDNEPIDRKSVV